MKKKTYEQPAVEVMELRFRQLLKTASEQDDTTGPVSDDDDDTIDDEGQVW